MAAGPVYKITLVGVPSQDELLAGLLVNAVYLQLLLTHSQGKPINQEEAIEKAITFWGMMASSFQAARKEQSESS